MVFLFVLVYKKLAEGPERNKKKLRPSGNCFQQGYYPKPICCIGTQGLALAKRCILSAWAWINLICHHDLGF